MEYHVVDVFAERPLEGNPLTVVPDAHGLDESTMQAIARETNHSETTFVTGKARDGALPTRIFTPQLELPFAGHPTLGTAAVTGATALHLAVGRIPVCREGELFWMTQPPTVFDKAPSQSHVADALGIPIMDVAVASTGNRMLLVEVADSDTLRAASLDVRRFDPGRLTGVYVWTEGGDHDLHARFFAEFVGIKEDPATGSAAGPLAGHLHATGRLDTERVVHQGMEMRRPSRIHIRGTADAPEVGGKVQAVARGHFTL